MTTYNSDTLKNRQSLIGTNNSRFRKDFLGFWNMCVSPLRIKAISKWYIDMAKSNYANWFGGVKCVEDHYNSARCIICDRKGNGNFLSNECSNEENKGRSEYKLCVGKQRVEKQLSAIDTLCRDCCGSHSIEIEMCVTGSCSIFNQRHRLQGLLMQREN